MQDSSQRRSAQTARASSSGTLNGTPRLGYGALSVKDARGRVLPARIELAEACLRIVIDDAGATYPIDVDPLVWGRQAQLVPFDGAPGDRFGDAVAVEATTAIVGAPGTNSGAGSVFVLTQSSVVWTLPWMREAKLRAPEPGARRRVRRGGLDQPRHRRRRRTGDLWRHRRSVCVRARWNDVGRTLEAGRRRWSRR